MSSADPEVVVVINLATTIPLLLDQAKSIVSAIQTNAATWFGTPNPTMAAMLNLITAVEQAQTVVNTRARGAAAARAPKVKALKGGIKSLASYVLGVALNHPGEEQAVIEAGGFKMKAVPRRTKLPLDVRLGAKSGEVLLIAKAGPRRKIFYDWRYSLDGGKTWVEAASTNYASTTIDGLPALTTALFQVRFTIKNVPGPWSQSVSRLVQ